MSGKPPTLWCQLATLALRFGRRKPGWRGSCEEVPGRECGGGTGALILSGQAGIFPIESGLTSIGPTRSALRMTSARGLGFFQVEGVVEQARQKSAGQRSDPVDAVIGPMVGSERGAEGAGGIHRRAGERPAHEDVHGDGEADGEAGDFV